ncbi:MAG: hypothetical protein C6I00_05210 [Nitratiruptor sp.]|nr:hypothetical protein [Nitratiruptor sp.]NPA83497.1 hypothetical protein [Campylobacterota bacterium]
MKELKTSLLLALATILAAIAILKLTKNEPLLIPVPTVEANKSKTILAHPIVPPEEDRPETDPLGLFAKTTFSIPSDGFQWVLYQGKLYPIRNGRVQLPGRYRKPLSLTLVQQIKLCSIPKAAASKRQGQWFVTDANGSQIPLQVARVQEGYLLATPPCPTFIRLNP